MERFLFLVVVLLLVPSAAAGTLDLHGSSLEAGGAFAGGDAAVVHADNAKGTQMTLRAQRVHVEEYIEDRDPSQTYADMTGPETHTREAYHEDVDWTGGITASNGYVLVTAAGRADVGLATQALRVGLPLGQQHKEVGPVPYGEPAVYTPTVGGLTFLQSRETHVEVQGDFVVRYWNGRLAGPTADGHATHEAGWSNRTGEPVPPNRFLYWSRDVFVTLHVTNGTLTFSSPSSADLFTYLEGPTHLRGTSALLRDAIGTVDGRTAADTVVLEEFSVLAEATPDGLHVWSPPEGRASLVGGISASPASLAASVLAVLAVAAVALVVRAYRPVSVKTLLDSMDRKRYRRVVRHAGPVLRRTGSEAVAVMKAVALLALGRARRALRFLEDLPADLRPADGMDPFLRAHAWNELGETDEARRSLLEALGQNPGLVVELAQFPRLRALLPDDDAPSEVYA